MLTVMQHRSYHSRGCRRRVGRVVMNALAAILGHQIKQNVICTTNIIFLNGINFECARVCNVNRARAQQCVRK